MYFWKNDDDKFLRNSLEHVNVIILQNQTMMLYKKYTTELLDPPIFSPKHILRSIHFLLHFQVVM